MVNKFHSSDSLKLSKPVTESSGLACQKNDGNFVAQLYLFGAQLIAGVGQSLKHTLGISFLDDNIKKSKTPALISNLKFTGDFTRLNWLLRFFLFHQTSWTIFWLHPEFNLFEVLHCT